MLRKPAKTMLILCGGLVLGGMVGRFRVTMRYEENSRKEQSVVFHEEQFANASSIDSAMMLARQLPLADAKKCAALANAMLIKRIQVPVEKSPDADNSQKTFEEQMLPDYVWEGLFKRWMQVAPQAAWAFVEKHHSNKLPLRLVALRQWALLDPLPAAKAAGKTISEEEQIAIVKACIEMNPAIGLNLLVEWGVDLSEYENTAYPEDDSLAGVMSALLAKYAEKSPREALDFCQRHSPKLLSDVCAGWMRKDAAGCLEWINVLPIADQKAIFHVLTREPDVSADTVRRFVAMRSLGEDCKEFEPGLSSIARRDALLAQGLIDEFFTNPTDRMVLREGIASEMRSADPRKAMDFIMPSLREPLPIYQEPPLPGKTHPGYGYDHGPDYGEAPRFFNDFVALGPAAGVTKEEILRRLNEMNPQYRTSMIKGGMGALLTVLGRPAEWMASFAEEIPSDELVGMLYELQIYSSVDMENEIKASPAGALRDALVEYSLEMMLNEDQPVATVVEKAKEWGGDVDWSEIYDDWVVQAPEQALQHFMNKPSKGEREWKSMIAGAYASHAQSLERAVEQMPQGKLRETAVRALASAAMSEKHDVVTSIYWATEVKNRADRSYLMQQLWSEWQNLESASQDPKVIEGVRQNIENSKLDAAEKKRLMERLESEVFR